MQSELRAFLEYAGDSDDARQWLQNEIGIKPRQVFGGGFIDYRMEVKERATSVNESQTPKSQKVVKAFIEKHHRHLPTAPVGDKTRFSIFNGDDLVGVCMIGRPARTIQDGKTMCVTRLAVDESLGNKLTHDACSQLLGACKRWCKRNGIERLFTYTLSTESGSSVKAAGFKFVGNTKTSSKGHSRKGRPRKLNGLEAVKKNRWVCEFN
jgi:N-acetylglutamate synthase-like GNAT family acetyltransferase